MDTLFLVPDFRFGNKAVVNPKIPANHAAVDRSLISPENDAKMYSAVMTALEAIRDKNPRCRFVFWCFAGREEDNRFAGKYFENGVYRHPTWNLSDAEERLGSQVISLRPLIEHPHGRSFRIDDSQHPSFLGHELLRRLIADPDIDLPTTISDIVSTSTQVVVRATVPTVITGHSHWLTRLDETVSRRLVRLEGPVDIVDPKTLFTEPPGRGTRVVYVSGLQRVLRPDPLRRATTETVDELRRLGAQGADVRIVPWENKVSVSPAPTRVGQPALWSAAPEFAPIPPIAGWTAGVAPFTVEDFDLEHDQMPTVPAPTGDVPFREGARLRPIPTTHGIEKLLRAVGFDVSHEPFLDPAP
ncbi:hypothetical protein [Brevibacterium samyangense]